MTKHRIIGFIVIVALIVIVTEVLLSYRPIATSQHKTVTIPEEPVVNRDAIEDTRVAATPTMDITPIDQAIETDKSSNNPPSQTTEQNTLKYKNKYNNKPMAKKTANHLMQAHAWVVQVASYTDQIHADQLVQQLQKQGFDAFDYQIKVHDKTYIRVNIGPATSQAMAKQVQQQLLETTKLKGIVVSYTPSDEFTQNN